MRSPRYSAPKRISSALVLATPADSHANYVRDMLHAQLRAADLKAHAGRYTVGRWIAVPLEALLQP